MRLICLLLFIICVCSCAKNDPLININEYKERYLICDSFKTIVDGHETVTIKGFGTGLDVMFDTMRTHTIYSTPIKKYNYAEKYSKIYYWEKTSTIHEGDVYTIEYKSSQHLNLGHTDHVSGEKIIYYYTAN